MAIKLRWISGRSIPTGTSWHQKNYDADGYENILETRENQIWPGWYMWAQTILVQTSCKTGGDRMGEHPRALSLYIPGVFVRVCTRKLYCRSQINEHKHFWSAPAIKLEVSSKLWSASTHIPTFQGSVRELGSLGSGPGEQWGSPGCAQVIVHHTEESAIRSLVIWSSYTAIKPLVMRPYGSLLGSAI